jgi:3-methyladenine DNA glycosylase/8-oxoguanine DNA glycosylase
MTLRYLGRDPHNQAEVVQGRRYSRFITLDKRPLPVTLTLAARTCTLEFPARLRAGEILRLIDTTGHMLGLRQPVAAFQRTAEQHDVLRPIVQAMPGVRMIQTPNLWEALSWAIIGQQINLAFAYKLRNRLIFLGNGHDAPAPRPLPFPTPGQVLGLTPDALKQAQFSRQKIAYLLELARQFETDGLAALSLDTAAPEEIEARLLSIKGLGRWSVAYGMMRGLGHLDALPVGDAGLRQALRARFNLEAVPDPETQERLMAPFRPYRGLATYYLWKSLDPANFG